jgi:mannose-6-phosphate isomerase class I
MNQVSLIVEGVASEFGKRDVNLRILIDDIELEDFDYYALDLQCLKESTITEGKYFLITCTCGEPECAGIMEPVEIKHGENVFVWNFTEPFERELTLSKAQLMKQVQRAEEKLNRLGFSNFSDQQFRHG